MTKIIVSIILVIGVVVAVLVFRNKPAIAPGGESLSPTPEATGSIESTVSPKPAVTGDATSSPSSTPEVKNQVVTIVFADNTATPNSVDIHIGDTVTFVNNDSVLHRPASGVHPIHEICRGFDSLRGLKTGESYSYTFNEAKTCPWHDHLKPSLNGKIVVDP